MLAPPPQESCVHLSTNGWHPQGVRFHPRTDQRIAVAAARNFGLKGPGCVQILPHGIAIPMADAVFAVAWSEENDEVLVAALANGQLVLFEKDRVVATWAAHGKEVSAVDWNCLDRRSIVSASWDGTVKVWNGAQELLGQRVSNAPLYQVKWHPREAALLATVGAEGRLHLVDVRMPNTANTLFIPGGECLCLDWNKYDGMTVATGSVDGTIRLWDLRTQAQTQVLSGHRRAVKDVRWSPWSPDDLISASLDMSVRRWSRASLNPLVWVDEQPTEFVTGVDWSLQDPRLIAYCAWDQLVRLHSFPK